MKSRSMLLLSHVLLLVFSISLSAMDFVIKQDVSLNSISQLHKAASKGNVELLKQVLASGECAFINEQNIFGNTPLLIAAKRGHQDCALILMAHDADVTLSNIKGRTVLHFARKLRLLKVIDALLDEFDSATTKLLIDELASRRVDSQVSSRQLLALDCAKQGCLRF